MKIGFYSQKAEVKYGSMIYTTPSGGTTVVTAVQEASSLSDYDDSSYKWDDKVMIGEVVQFVQTATIGINERLLQKEYKILKC
jgi:hypothetical protein